MDRCPGNEWSYAGVGSSADRWPAGFSRDETQRVVGRGREAFEEACRVLERWEQFPQEWARMETDGGPPAAGQGLCMVARVGPLWWLNAARVVGVVDLREIGYFAVTQGTLHGHAACGEERFWVELTATGEVIYGIRAFSRPAHWMARLGRPLMRRLQRRFVAESMAAMERRVAR